VDSSIKSIGMVDILRFFIEPMDRLMEA